MLILYMLILYDQKRLLTNFQKKRPQLSALLYNVLLYLVYQKITKPLIQKISKLFDTKKHETFDTKNHETSPISMNSIKTRFITYHNDKGAYMLYNMYFRR